jgi:hypothetical protein
MINKLLDKLPDIYNKNEGSNVYNLIKLAADHIEKGEQVLELINDWRDIDQAQGNVLEKIGKEVGQARRGLDDDAYRQRIKIKIRANLSGGEIETLNTICGLLIGERFEGIQEGWTLPLDHPIGPKPAMMLLTLRADGINMGIPMAEIGEISAGGVVANWQLIIPHKVNMASTFTASNESFNVYDANVEISGEYEKHEQRYANTGELTIGAGTLNTMEGLG